jgi:polygalacturonase
VTNLTMCEVTTAPIFLRIGNRGRGPEGTPVGAMRRIAISNVIASDIEPRFAASIAGLAGHPVEDVTLSNIRLAYRGGGTVADAQREPPEVEDAYPEPSMFGTLPSYGFYVRHARRLTLRDVAVSTMNADARPPIWLHDADELSLDGFDSSRPLGVAFALLRDVRNLRVRNVAGVVDGVRRSVASGKIPEKEVGGRR